MANEYASGRGVDGMMTRVSDADGLLLDIGGVVLRNIARLMHVLAEQDERLAVVVAELGIATERDGQWAAMLAHEVTERAYWAQRAADLGAAVGEQWTTRTMINRVYETPAERWLVPQTIELMRDARDAGIPVGALTNDLRDFHGQDWVDRQFWVAMFDVVVDASVTGVLKPDPRAYTFGAEALGLPAHRIVYLDDMPWNITGGLQAGLQAVQVDLDDPSAAVGEARRRLGLTDERS